MQNNRGQPILRTYWSSLIGQNPYSNLDEFDESNSYIGFGRNQVVTYLVIVSTNDGRMN